MCSTFAPPHLIAEFDHLAILFDVTLDCRAYGCFGRLTYRAGEHEPLHFSGDGIVEAMRSALRIAGEKIKQQH